LEDWIDGLRIAYNRPNPRYDELATSDDSGRPAVANRQPESALAPIPHQRTTPADPESTEVVESPLPNRLRWLTPFRRRGRKD
jgi:hypothetical protein